MEDGGIGGHAPLEAVKHHVQLLVGAQCTLHGPPLLLPRQKKRSVEHGNNPVRVRSSLEGRVAPTERSGFPGERHTSGRIANQYCGLCGFLSSYDLLQTIRGHYRLMIVHYELSVPVKQFRKQNV